VNALIHQANPKELFVLTKALDLPAVLAHASAAPQLISRIRHYASFYRQDEMFSFSNRNYASLLRNVALKMGVSEGSNGEKLNACTSEKLELMIFDKVHGAFTQRLSSGERVTLNQTCAAMFGAIAAHSALKKRKGSATVLIGAGGVQLSALAGLVSFSALLVLAPLAILALTMALIKEREGEGHLRELISALCVLASIRARVRLNTRPHYDELSVWAEGGVR
jgi:hypothetical protein